MSESSTYVISQVVNKTGLKSHTIRYWEEQLKLNIPRNNMGHRYYTDRDIELFLHIKDLKEKGYQLKAIELELSQEKNSNEVNQKVSASVLEDDNVISLESRYKHNYDNEGRDSLKKQDTNPIVANEEEQDAVNPQDANKKMEQFQQIMTRIISEAIKENNMEVTNTICETVTDNVIKEMDYLFRVKEDHEEERFKKFDELLRDVQKSRQEAAVTTSTGKKKKKRRLFRR